MIVGQAVSISASIGLVTLEGLTRFEPEPLLELVDHSLCAAKRDGRNRTCASQVTSDGPS